MFNAPVLKNFLILYCKDTWSARPGGRLSLYILVSTKVSILPSHGREGGALPPRGTLIRIYYIHIKPQ